MKGVYLIRHGDADYYNDCLIQEGRSRVLSLSELLDGLLPNGKKYSLVSSPSGRAKETAQLLIPLLRDKVGRIISIDEDSRLSELRSIENYQELKKIGIENLALLDDYDCDIGIFIAHERLIRAVGYAIAERFGISLPDGFLPSRNVIELKKRHFMSELECTEEEALKLIEESNDVFFDMPQIGLANALYFNLESRVAKLLKPDY